MERSGTKLAPDFPCIAIAQRVRKLRGFWAPLEVAKRLECAASRRFHFDPSETSLDSAGMRRTPNASRGSVAVLPRCEMMNLRFFAGTGRFYPSLSSPESLR